MSSHPVPPSQRWVLAPDLIATKIAIVDRLTFRGMEGNLVTEDIIPVPFSPKVIVPLPETLRQEKIYLEGKNLSPEIQFLPKKHLLVKQIQNIPKTASNLVSRYQFLVERAQELKEIYGKMEVARKYPEWAVRTSKKKGQFRISAISVNQDDVSVRADGILEDKVEGSQLLENGANEKLRRRLHEIFGNFRPIVELNKDDYWQFRVERSMTSKKKVYSPKRFWKPNSYPPKTEAERVKSIREKTKNGKQGQVDMDDDILSGFWIPELMTSEFQISGINYSSSSTQSDLINGPDWYELQVINDKCNQWLTKNLEFL